MDEVMIVGAQRPEVGQVGWSAAFPGDDVVDLVRSRYRRRAGTFFGATLDARSVRGDRVLVGQSALASRVVICITFRHTMGMAKAISVRLDDETQRALRSLEDTGLSQSEAIRSALLTSAERLKRHSAVAAEVAALEADEADRAEMLSIASMMESMRAAG
ncbi:MAG TPA: hypothetical protein VF065_15115 [Ilumatobacter sp.]